MDKHIDFFLAKVLKQWVATRHPPAGGRERLLQKAAIPQPQSPNKNALSWLPGQEAVRLDVVGMAWPLKLTDWLYYSFRPGYGNFSAV
jgi:hypothetical protein